MQQLDMIEALEHMPTPRERGAAAAQACTDKAERVTQFDTTAARAFVLEHLQRHGASWGEAIVDAAAKTGNPKLLPHDGRSWGSIFSTLARQQRIRCLRADGIRRCGHGTTGARQWTLAP